MACDPAFYRLQLPQQNTTDAIDLSVGGQRQPWDYLPAAAAAEKLARQLKAEADRAAMAAEEEARRRHRYDIKRGPVFFCARCGCAEDSEMAVRDCFDVTHDGVMSRIEWYIEKAMNRERGIGRDLGGSRFVSIGNDAGLSLAAMSRGISATWRLPEVFGTSATKAFPVEQMPRRYDVPIWSLRGGR